MRGLSPALAPVPAAGDGEAVENGLATRSYAVLQPRIGDALLVVTAVALVLLGAVVVVGWHTQTTQLMQLHPDFVPMQFNTALGFIGSGLALFCLATGRTRLGSLLGFAIFASCGLTLLQYATGWQLGIDEFWMRAYLTVETSHPGRMAPNTAVCFVLAGLALQLYRLPQAGRVLLLPALGLLICCLGLIAASGYVLGTQVAYGWGSYTRMALHTALGFCALGGGLVGIAARERPWRLGVLRVAAPVGLLSTVLALWAWNTLEGQQQDRLRELARMQAQLGVQTLESNLRRDLDGFERLAMHLADPEHASGAWRRDAQQILLDMPQLRAIYVVSRERQLAEPARDTVRAQELLSLLRLPPQPQQLMPLALSGGWGIVYPLQWHRNEPARLIFVFDLRSWLQENLAEAPFGWRLRHDGLTLAADTRVEASVTGGTQRVALPVADGLFTLEMWLAPELLRRFGTLVPSLVLLFGLTLSALLTLVLVLWQASRERHRMALGEMVARDEVQDTLLRRSRELQSANARLTEFLRSVDTLLPTLRRLGRVIGQRAEDVALESLTQPLQLGLHRVESQSEALHADRCVFPGEAQPGAVDLGRVLAQVEQALARSLSAAGATLSGAADLPLLVCPATLVYETLRDVVGAALICCDDAGAELRLSWSQAQGELIFTVSRHSHGIAARAPARTSSWVAQAGSAFRHGLPEARRALDPLQRRLEALGGRIWASAGRDPAFHFSLGSTCRLGADAGSTQGLETNPAEWRQQA